jgi:hypothetical protein
MSETRTWTVTIVFTEDGDKTRADATLVGAPDEIRGWGRSKRNPLDPKVAEVGEEVAAARALHDVAHHLIEQAMHRIEGWEGHPVHVTESRIP